MSTMSHINIVRPVQIVRSTQPRHCRTGVPIGVAAVAMALAGCAASPKPAPDVPLSRGVKAQPVPEPAKPVQIVEVPKPLPLPGQLKPLPGAEDASASPANEPETSA